MGELPRSNQRLRAWLPTSQGAARLYKDYQPSVQLYAVEVEEVNPPKGTEKIQWRLLTTHSVVCL